MTPLPGGSGLLSASRGSKGSSALPTTAPSKPLGWAPFLSAGQRFGHCGPRALVTGAVTRWLFPPAGRKRPGAGSDPAPRSAYPARRRWGGPWHTHPGGCRSLARKPRRPAYRRQSPDGRYFLFASNRGGSSNIWALRETQTFLQRRPQQPVQLTTGPTEFWGGVPSRGGKRLFVLGRQPQVELVRYDLKSGQFSPYLPGTRAGSVSFSRDNEWMAYIVSPEAALWRSKADGTSRRQLTFPPHKPVDARWSPDGNQIAFWTAPSSGELTKVYLISAEGGNPREVAPAWHGKARPDWSPDGGSLVFEVSGGLRLPHLQWRHFIRSI